MIVWLFSPQVECKNLKHLLREICNRETTSSVHEEENTELLREDSVHNDAEDKLKPSFISSVSLNFIIY